MEKRKVFVLLLYYTPFDTWSPASEQVSLLGVYTTYDAAEAAWQDWCKRLWDGEERYDWDIIESYVE